MEPSIKNLNCALGIGDLAALLEPSEIATAVIGIDGSLLYGSPSLYRLWDRVAEVTHVDRASVQKDFITTLQAERGKRRWTSRIIGDSTQLCIEVVAGRTLSLEGRLVQLILFVPMDANERNTEHPYIVGPLRVDEDTGYVMWNREYLDLTQSEFNVLVHLVRNADKPVHKRELLRVVWGSRNATTRVMDITVSRLRAKFKKIGAPAGLLHTVHGTGYMFRAWLLAEQSASPTIH
ncbi:MAG: winged helix-turn-helix transcriptional regulator [Bdellovibrionales bacterium]|nr:winged helix-turn-helix transcriptional regulator [Bdellovibrionales bacterium]